jgi:exodeoxyribonuclease VII small subunit
MMDEDERVVGGNGKSFEENLARIESLVRQLERGDLSLEESLACYQEGVTLVAYCHKNLDQAAKAIELLTGEIFDTEDDDDEDM